MGKHQGPSASLRPEAPGSPVAPGRLGRGTFVALLLLGAIVLLPGSTAVDFWDPREPMYVQAGREMLAGRSFLVPLHAGQTVRESGLLTYWSVMLGSALLRPVELGARAGGMLVAWSALFAVYHVVSRLRGRWAGIFSAAVLATSPLFYLLAHRATPDVLESLAFGMALLFGAAILYDPQRRRRDFVLLPVCAGAVVLAGSPTRAPLVLILSAVAFGAMQLDIAAVARFLQATRGRRRRLVLALLPPIALLAVWIATLAFELGDPPKDRWFEFRGEDHPFHAYLRPLLFGFFPWSCFLVAALPLLIRWRRHDPAARAGLELLMLASSLVTLAYLGSLPDKWPSYLGLLLVPCSVLTGLVLDRLTCGRQAAATRTIWLLLIALCAPAMLDLVEGAGPTLLLGGVTGELTLPAVTFPTLPLVVALGAIGLALVGSAIWSSRIWVGALVLGCVGLALYGQLVLLPQLNGSLSMSRLCGMWKAGAEPDQPIGLVGDPSPAAYYYCDAEIERVHESNFLGFMNPARAALCLIEQDELERFSGVFGKEYPGHELRVVDAAHPGYVLTSNRPGG